MKKVFFIIIAILLIAQFFRPEKNLGDPQTIATFESDTKPNKEVKLILEQACYDCHSDVTSYPWYNNITPVNFWLAHHVDEGKEHFNISKWNEYSTKKKDHKLEELIEMVEDKSMPLDSYTWAHADAKLSDSQIKSVVEWAKEVRANFNQ